MMRWFYTVLFYCLSPLVVLRLLYRARKSPAYKQRIAERFGFFYAPSAGVVYLGACGFGR